MLTLKKLVLIAACVTLALGAFAVELPQQNKQRHLRSLESAAFQPGRVVAATTDAENPSTPAVTHQEYEWVDEPPASYGAQVGEGEEVDGVVVMADTTIAEGEEEDSSEDSSDSEEEDGAPDTTSALTKEQANGPQESEQDFAAVAATANDDVDQEDNSEDSVEYPAAATNDGDDQEVAVNLEEGENEIKVDAAPGDIIDIDIEDAN